MIGIASDHAGYELKGILIPFLKGMGKEVKDFGCNSPESMDYPDVAHPLAQAIEKGEIEIGITICGSGNGISMTMNKYPSIRAALCWEPELAALAKQHNNANVLSLPARFISTDNAKEIVKMFFASKFEGGRHLRRINKIPIKK
ncbi:MAG: ribose 5-phosphate isomerase B [Bacteroidales bacterium]